MAYVVQQRARFSGIDFEVGDILPAELEDEIATVHVINMGLVASIPDEAVANSPRREVPSATDDPSADGGSDGDSAYDPSDHTVAEVLDYVEAHPDEVDAIRAAEEAGKGRTTLLDGLDDLAADSDEGDSGGDGSGDDDSEDDDDAPDAGKGNDDDPDGDDGSEVVE